MVGQIILPGVPAGVCVPQHGHCPQPRSLGSQGEISDVLALYFCLGERGTGIWKVKGCVSCHRALLCNGCCGFVFRAVSDSRYFDRFSSALPRKFWDSSLKVGSDHYLVLVPCE